MGKGFAQQAARFGQASDFRVAGRAIARCAPAGRARCLAGKCAGRGRRAGWSREFRAVEHGHFGVAAGGARDFDRQFLDAFIAHDLAADQEGIACGEGGGKALPPPRPEGCRPCGFSAELSGFRCR